MPAPTPAMVREEIKVEALTRLDELARELRAVRVLVAQYWPAGLEKASTPAIAR